ncbi:MAG TPA: tripartite tricarboxylate transporter TctB family protein [Xanthobacteraceae bacterium]|jgi:putative tricarboxylic transport membrane protein|nr:tripartite tricarboxylate transporter TctB family protein [Xanthobacteraceae bacterium]
MRIRAPKDFWSGVMFCGFAATALSAARGYSLGSAGRMGPGYFPLLLASLLGALGAVLIGRSILIGGEPVARFHVLPLAVIATAISLFGVLIEPLGLVVSLAVLTVMSAWVGAQFRLAETLALAAALILFCVGVFVYVLGLPLNLWPSL